MSAHGDGVRCPVGARSIEHAHQLGTRPDCAMCMMRSEAERRAAWWERNKGKPESEREPWL